MSMAIRPLTAVAAEKLRKGRKRICILASGMMVPKRPIMAMMAPEAPRLKPKEPVATLNTQEAKELITAEDRYTAKNCSLPGNLNELCITKYFQFIVQYFDQRIYL